MSKQLYDEALADIRNLSAVAEDNAKRALIDAVTPNIKQLIETALLTDNEPASGAITPPDADGKVTLDVDGLKVDTEAGQPVDAPVFGRSLPLPDDAELELSLDMQSLEPLAVEEAASNDVVKKLEEGCQKLETFISTKNVKKASTNLLEKVVSYIDSLYETLQKSSLDKMAKDVYEQRLETYFSVLNEEQKMKNRLNEEDVTLKLTGLPDELDLDNVNVDLVTGGDDVENDGDEEEVSSEEETSDDDLNNLDMQSGEEGDYLPAEGEGEEEELEQEALKLSDDTIVEIDEGMLRREIARLRKINEAKDCYKVPSSDGFGVTDNVIDDFGGAEDLGDPLEVEIVDEAVEEDEDVVDVEEGDTADLDTDDEVSEVEGCSEARRQVPQMRVSEARGVAAVKSAAAKASVDKLHKKLAEANLCNVKLLLTNKLLQNESLSPRQKAKVVEQLDEAKTVREANIAYDSMTRTLAKRVNESAQRGIVGSSSAPTRSGSASSTSLLKESVETDRWAKLAGIKTK